MATLLFKSKISLGILSFIVAIMGSILAVTILNKNWAALLILLPTIAFIVHLYLTTYYIIKDDILIVKSGLLKKEIPVKSIRKVIPTKNPLSAPALSFDRLEIFYNRFDSVLISPEEKQQFIKVLKNINPAIEG
jgi:hypothetical protein